MHLFFIENINIESNTITFDTEESKHIARTLRMKKGDNLYVTNGRGTKFNCEITDDNQKCCEIKIIDFEETINQREYSVHIACALTKNIARIEFFLEKAVEIGLDEFTPVVFKHSERVNFKHDRFKKIAISALKQSHNYYLPTINTIVCFDDFLKQIKTDNTQKFIAFQNEDEKHLIKKVQSGKNVIVLIGPEGDFSKNEIEKAIQEGFEIAYLGNNRLRTETAALLACNIVNLCNIVN